MDSNEADPGTAASQASDNPPDHGCRMPSAPGVAIENDSATSKANQPERATGGKDLPQPHGTSSLDDEIQALKAKIIELEQHTKAGTDEPTREQSRPELMAEMEQYKRIEACIYRHRKEWESNVGPGQWDMTHINQSPFMTMGDHEHGPWLYNWPIRNCRVFDRPDPFDPSHVCSDVQHGIDSNAFDDFDHTIEYGGRRERLRKNFEWEMDRLYLAEEIERRRKKKIQEGEQSKEEAQTEKKKDSGESSPPIVDHIRLDWFSFRRGGEKGGWVIEVLTGEPVLDDFGPYRSWYGYSGRRAYRPDRSIDQKVPLTTSTEQRPLPERIRIRSPVLLSILGTILGSECQIRGDSVSVFIRPFKALVYCERALRDWCSALEKKFQALPGTEGDDTVVGTASGAHSREEDGPVFQQATVNAGRVSADGDAIVENLSAFDSESRKSQTQFSQQIGDSQSRSAPDKIQEEKDDDEEQGNDNPNDEDDDGGDDKTKSPMALEHLKCLLSFINSDISARQTYLENPTGRRILFSDLWLLFRPGLEVIGSDGKQAYRVIHTTSAKHRATSPWQAWLDSSAKKRKDTPFSITCVYIDFDGKSLGPVQRIFDFKRFDGETEIGSLEVYPVRFHPAKESDFSEMEWKELKDFPVADRHRQRLINRGSRFLGAAAVKHMYYAGPTLEVKDDVESQVVIDFEMAFSTKENLDRSWEPELRSLVGVPASEEKEEEGNDFPCNADCCRGQFVHDDSYVDQKQRDEYVESLLPKVSAPDEQPSVAIIPRPLKELRTGHNEGFSVTNDELVIMSYRVFGFVLRS